MLTRDEERRVSLAASCVTGFGRFVNNLSHTGNQTTEQLKP